VVVGEGAEFGYMVDVIAAKDESTVLATRLAADGFESAIAFRTGRLGECSARCFVEATVVDVSCMHSNSREAGYCSGPAPLRGQKIRAGGVTGQPSAEGRLTLDIVEAFLRKWSIKGVYEAANSMPVIVAIFRVLYT
jgi:hypothetical protein